MAISKERKQEIVDQYVEWISDSRAFFLADYLGLTMNDLDNLRARVRESGGEFHVVKNTLTKIAFDRSGLKYPEHYLEGATAIGFAFEDAPSMAKAISEFARETDFLTIKGGFLDKRLITTEDIIALAELPPLPVMRAQLLGTLLAPASKLVRTLAEPARSLAAVLQAYAEQQGQGAQEQSA